MKNLNQIKLWAAAAMAAALGTTPRKPAAAGSPSVDSGGSTWIPVMDWRAPQRSGPPLWHVPRWPDRQSYRTQQRMARRRRNVAKRGGAK